MKKVRLDVAFDCDVCTESYRIVSQSADGGTPAQPELPHGWSRSGVFLFCPQHAPSDTVRFIANSIAGAIRLEHERHGIPLAPLQ